MTKGAALILLLFFLSCTIQAQDTTSLSFTVIYQGKNLYVQNPFYNDTAFCTCKVNVNQQKQNINLERSSYEIDLSAFHTNDTLQVQIVHYKSCKPKLLNPFVGHNRLAVIKNLSSWGNTLVCTYKESTPKGVFYVEHFEYNSWVTKANIPAKSGDTLFTVSVRPFSGINKYRLKFVAANGEVCYSAVMEKDFEESKLEVKIDKEKKQVYFSREAEFNIMNDCGEVVLEGYVVSQEISKLKEGVYYLNADNRTEKIKIK